jgi:hypothetical protein
MSILPPKKNRNRALARDLLMPVVTMLKPAYEGSHFPELRTTGVRFRGLYVAATLALLAGGCGGKTGAGTGTGGIASPTHADGSSRAELVSRPRKGDLCRAIRDGADAKTIAELVERGADVNENLGDEENRITPLIVASLSRSPHATNIRAFLLSRMAHADATYEGYTADDIQLGQRQTEE